MKNKCDYCTEEYIVKNVGSFNRNKRNGLKLYCSIKCRGLGRRKPIEEKKKIKTEYNKGYREELQDCYVAGQLARRWGVKSKDIMAIPGLVEAYKAKILLIRTIRNHGKQD
jgi:hypothetical protein